MHAFFAAALSLAPCTIAGAQARCGTFDVPEAADSNRPLHLKLIVLPATERNASAIFPMSGGPGQTVTDAAPFIVQDFAAERRLHDIALLDLRGTEGSALCPSAVKAHGHEIVEGDLFPLPLVADCRKEVEAKADPRHFTLNEFADDIEALRIALGYGPINIIALSYGTRAALTFEARHPKSVRAILMYGPLPPDNLPPLNFAADAQSVMDHIIPAADVQKALAALPVKIVRGGYTITITRGMFAEYLRTNLYTFEKQNRIPEIVRQAIAGDWKSIAAGFIDYRKSWYDDLGVFLSITCPTDVRNISPLEIGPATSRSFLGDYRVLRQSAACEAWTPGVLPRLHVSSEPVPILIFVGDRDAVTPKRWADVLAHEAPSVRTVVFPNSGHGELSPCAQTLETAFLDAGSFDKLDDSCARKP